MKARGNILLRRISDDALLAELPVLRWARPSQRELAVCTSGAHLLHSLRDWDEARGELVSPTFARRPLSVKFSVGGTGSGADLELAGAPSVGCLVRIDCLVVSA